MDTRPSYPIKVWWPCTEPEVFENATDIESRLEWFDSESEKGPTRVTDNYGHEVILKLDGLQIIEFRLKAQDSAIDR